MQPQYNEKPLASKLLESKPVKNLDLYFVQLHNWTSGITSKLNILVPVKIKITLKIHNWIQKNTNTNEKLMYTFTNKKPVKNLDFFPSTVTQPIFLYYSKTKNFSTSKN